MEGPGALLEWSLAVLSGQQRVQVSYDSHVRPRSGLPSRHQDLHHRGWAFWKVLLALPQPQLAPGTDVTWRSHQEWTGEGVRSGGQVEVRGRCSAFRGFSSDPEHQQLLVFVELGTVGKTPLEAPLGLTDTLGVGSLRNNHCF